MKYNIENISSNDYLNLVNTEIEPTDPTLKIRYCKLGENQYFAFANCNKGRIMSPLALLKEDQVEAYFDGETDRINKYFESRKDSELSPKPLTSILSF